MKQAIFFFISFVLLFILFFAPLSYIMEIQQPKQYSQFDQFKIIRVLGSGMEATYVQSINRVKLAEDPDGNKMAIKKYNSNHCNSQAIQNEVKIIKKFNHQNIIKLIDCRPKATYIKKDGTKYECSAIIFEYAGGGQLFDYIVDSGRFSDKMSRSYFGQLMNGLHHMHDKGYVHRDLKPENLLLSDDYMLKIGDFGFSCLKQGRKKNGMLTTRLGTPGYMAPQIYQKNYDGQKADIFAAGVILFILYSGRPPFSLPNNLDVFYSLIIEKKYDKFWREYEKKQPKNYYSSQFKDLIQKMIAYDPSQRPTIVQIAQHPWISGEVPKQDELKKQFGERKQKVKDAAEKRRIQEQAKKNQSKQQINQGNVNVRSSEKISVGEAFVDDLRAERHKGRNLKLVEEFDGDQLILTDELAYVVVRLKELLKSLEMDLNADPFQTDKIVRVDRQELLHLDEVQDNQSDEILVRLKYKISFEQDEQSCVCKLLMRFILGKDHENHVVLKCQAEEGNWFYALKVWDQVKKTFSQAV